MDNLKKGLLITYVQDYPCLYEINKKTNKDICMKENAWKKITAKLNEINEDVITIEMVEEVKNTFKNLRDRYMRLRKVCNPGSKRSGSSAGYGEKWMFFDAMKFIEPYLLHRKNKITNFPGETNQNENASCQSTETEFNDSILLNDIYTTIDPILASNITPLTFFEENVTGNDILDTNNQDSFSSVLSHSTVDDEKEGKNRKNFSSGKKRKHPGQDDDEITSYILKSIKKTDEYLQNKQQEDECALYGKFIAAQLRKLSEYQQDLARKRIDDVLWNIKWNKND